MSFNIKNPDDDIQVATAEPDGAVRIWGRADELGRRPFIRWQQFANWGAAKFYADEYEQSQRDARPIGRR